MQNLLSTWCYISLFLQWMLHLDSKFVGHGEKSCLRSWWAPRIGVASCLFTVQSIAHKFIKSVFVMFLWNYQNLWIIPKFCDYLAFTRKKTYNGLFDLEHGAQNEICPYILGDKGYLLLLIWFMIPWKLNINVRHTILEVAYNKHHSKGRSLIENAFGILKKTFKKLLLKNNLHILSMLDVVSYCLWLYNFIMDDEMLMWMFWCFSCTKKIIKLKQDTLKMIQWM